jgi:hypothetical protein
MELRTLKKQVELALDNFPGTRNSDVELTLKVWEAFYPEKIWQFEVAKGRKFIEMKSLFDLPREDNIKRIRAKIQNEEGRYLPTSWEVARKRGIEEDKWRVFMGYPAVNPNPNQQTIL